MALQDPHARRLRAALVHTVGLSKLSARPALGRRRKRRLGASRRGWSPRGGGRGVGERGIGRVQGGGRGGAGLARPRPDSRGRPARIVAAWRRDQSRSRLGTCVCARVVMEALPPPLATTTPASGRSRRLLMLPLLFFLLPAGALRAWEAEERPRTREEECHFYAGGQVYPGETSRVSAADHSLHLSKAKSRWCPARGEGNGWHRKAGGGEGLETRAPVFRLPPGGLAWAAPSRWP